MKNTAKTLLGALLISTIAVSPAVLAEAQTGAKATDTTMAKQSNKQNAQDKANNKAVQDKQKSQKDLLEEVNKGVSEGFKKVLEATQLINEGKDKEAIKALQEATGKFDVALAADPDMGLIPIAADVQVTQLLSTSDAVKAQVDLAIDLLKDSKVQAARAILLPLRDDMETRTAYLPMQTYPDAIKLATKLLLQENREGALETLATGLSTVVEKASIIPLSLVRAEAMIIAAADLDKEKEKDKALKLLDAAAEQLKFATVMGYTDEDSVEYDALKDQIKALKKEIKGGNVVERLYGKLKDSFKKLIDKKSEQKEKPADSNKAKANDKK